MYQKLTIFYYYLKYRYCLRFRNRHQLERWQTMKVRRHLKLIMRRSTFYNRLYQGHELSNLSHLPIITKQEMMTHFSELNTVAIVKEEAEAVAVKAEKERDFSSKLHGITVGLSTGTSGNRGLFLASDRERYMWSGAILAKMLPSGLLAKEKVAFFLRANSNLYETVKSRALSFKYFDTLGEPAANLQELEFFNPTILVAPASQLILIAKAVEEGTLHLACKKIISVAEVLEEMDRQRISQVFGQPIHQVYQATEGFIGSTCAYGTLHLNEDIVRIDKEYIDEENLRFFPIITDFSRVSQPILRYRLNDILIERKEPCPCGSCFTAIAHIEGRSDDVFYGLSKAAAEPVPLFSDFIRRAILFASPEITGYKVVQTSFKNICVTAQLNEATPASDDLKSIIAKEIEMVFETFGCELPEVTFENVFVLEKGRKLRRIERTFKIDE